MIVLDIDMPEKCGDCPCFYKSESIHPDTCQLRNKQVGYNDIHKERPDWCILKETE